MVNLRIRTRFLGNDPLGMVDGPNMYAYARNDPVNARDSSGCMSVPPNLINGAGGGTDLEECPGSGYETYNACVNAQHGTPPAGYDSVAEYCSDICYEQESTSTGGSSGSVLPEPPAGVECVVNAKWWGTKTVCNREAVEYLYSMIGGGGWKARYGIYFTSLVIGSVKPPIGVIIGTFGLFRDTLNECYANDQQLTISQSWILSYPVFRCEGA